MFRGFPGEFPGGRIFCGDFLFFFLRGELFVCVGGSKSGGRSGSKWSSGGVAVTGAGSSELRIKFGVRSSEFRVRSSEFGVPSSGVPGVLCFAGFESGVAFYS